MSNLNATRGRAMSVQQTRTGAWSVRWRDGGRMRSKNFRRRRDAERFDLQSRTPSRPARSPASTAAPRRSTSTSRARGRRSTSATLAPKTAKRYAAAVRRARLPDARRLRAARADPEIDRPLAGRPASPRARRSSRPARRSRCSAGSCSARSRPGGSGQTRSGSSARRHRRRATRSGRSRPRPSSDPRGAARRRGPRRSLDRRDVRALRDRDAVLVSLLAYAGLRPQELRALRWGHVRERTLVVHAPKTRRHRAAPRSVRLLAPLAQDLREWRLASGRPGDDAPVIPALDGSAMTEAALRAVARPSVDARRSRRRRAPISARTTCATASRRCCCTRAGR